MATGISVTMPKEQLVARLKEQEKIAKAVDAANLAEHRKVEMACLQTLRERARAATKWSYAEAKRHHFQVGITYDERPRCPNSVAGMFTAALKALALDSRTKFVLNPGNPIHQLVCWEPNPPARDLCG